MQYELMLIFSPLTGEADLKKELEEIKKLIDSNKGSVNNEDHWGLRDLAYPIRKQNQGIYVVWNFEFPNTEKLSQINKHLLLNQSVLRFLILKTPKNYKFLTLQEIEEKAVIEAQKLEKEKADQTNERPRREEKAPKTESKPKAKAKPEAETLEQKLFDEEVGEKVEEKAEKPAPKSKLKEKAEGKSTLDEVDEKLKNLINDPDISL